MILRCHRRLLYLKKRPLDVVRGKRTLSSVISNVQNICSLIDTEEYSIGRVVLWSHYLTELTLSTATWLV